MLGTVPILILGTSLLANPVNDLQRFSAVKLGWIPRELSVAALEDIIAFMDIPLVILLRAESRKVKQINCPFPKFHRRRSCLPKVSVSTINSADIL